MYLGKRDKEHTETLGALPLESCFAKTVKPISGTVCFGVDVETHSKIVGEVARILNMWFPQHMRDVLFPKGFDLLTAVHDVGKINPMFQEKIRRALETYSPNSEPSLKGMDPDRERSVDYHWGVGKASLRNEKPFVADIVGIHHGVTSSSRYLPDDQILGGPVWQNQRVALLERLKRYFDSDFPDISNDIHAAFLAGFTTVCDWIGSGTVFGDLQHIDREDIPALAVEAVEYAGFVAPMINVGLSFLEIFPGYEPLEIQRTFYEQVKEPGLYILEAQMGQGKTEAALMAAYNLISSGQATGIYFALPTRLTSEKIYDRFNKFLSSILKDSDPHRAMLIHGKDWLRTTDMGEDASPGSSWFDSRKRKILAPFAVGTIDQALMSVINVKHGFVRTFGLAGKVVIIDEIHTYGAYTGTLIDYLIRSLRHLGCTVILLSATLTKERKTRLVNTIESRGATSICDAYPLVTVATPNRYQELIPSTKCDEAEVSVVLEMNEIDILDTVKEKALAGELVLWIENTVPEAQNTFKRLASWGKQQDIEIGLLHSRFDPIQRQRLEEYWTDILGKPGIPKRLQGGKILVGTQVLEQSVDIDADFLVTRIAPSDMLLQRIGRLWRHQELIEKRPTSANREVAIIVPSREEILSNPSRAFGPSGMVYAPYILFRTYQTWCSLQNLIIPTDIRAIMESTYREIEDPEYILPAKLLMTKGKESLERHAYNSMSKLGKTISDEGAATRHSDVLTCDLLLLRNEPGHEVKSVCLLDGTVIRFPDALSKREQKLIARQIAERIISIPQYVAPCPLKEQEIQFLRPFMYISENEHERVRVAVVQESGRIVGLGGRAVNEDYDLFYSTVLGYRAEKRDRR